MILFEKHRQYFLLLGMNNMSFFLINKMFLWLDKKRKGKKKPFAAGLQVFQHHTNGEESPGWPGVSAGSASAPKGK